jgi:DNA polymerase I-like protein with 3'-5' exonuclease and polymerase domains
MLRILGCGDLPSGDVKSLEKAANRHPINALLTQKLKTIRKSRKLLSTYLTAGKEYKGRILYSLNPGGTDTGRLASKSSAFWCGLNIQNIPRGATVKQTLAADDGFMFFEVDLKQAESRDTAYIVGDEDYIQAVTGVRDFHSVNASAFFGIPYEDIFDDTKQKTVNKFIRDLAKRVNHGANYNMGVNVLIDSMGELLVMQAAKLLGLPKSFTLKNIGGYLLSKFHKAYPKISGVYYPVVVKNVLKTRLLTGASGWTRYCFGDPVKDKRALNAYVAHCPQSLNAMTLNRAFLKVFYTIAINPEHATNFKLCAQIHDSILFQCRVGHEYLAEQVKKCMEIPVTVVGCDGITREFTVPADIKGGKDGLGAKYWSDTE